MTKRVLSLFLALVMALSLCVPAIAAEDGFAGAVEEPAVTGEAPPAADEDVPAADEAADEEEAPAADGPAAGPASMADETPETPETAAVAAPETDEPAVIAANVDTETAAKLDETIARAQQIIPGIGTRYHVNGDDDCGRAAVETALEQLLEDRAHIRDGGAWDGILTTETVKGHIKAVTDLLDAVSEKATAAERAKLAWTALKDTVGTGESVDSWLDLVTAQEGDAAWMPSPSGWLNWNMALQPAYRAKLAEAVGAARLADTLGEDSHERVMALFQAVERLGKPFESAADGITAANNEYAKASMAAKSDLDRLQAIVSRLEGDIEAAGKDYAGEANTAAYGTAWKLWDHVKSAGCDNEAVATFLALAKALIEAGPEQASLYDVNILILTFEDAKITTMPYDLTLYSVVGNSVVDAQQAGSASREPAVTFNGISYVLRSLAYNTSADGHVYYVTYSVNGAEAVKALADNGKGPAAVLYHVNGADGKIQSGSVGSGSYNLQDTEFLYMQKDLQLNSGDQITVTLWGGHPKDGSNSEVLEPKKAGEITITLNKSYTGPVVYDGYAGYFGANSDAPDIGFFNAYDVDEDTMYVAISRKITDSDRFNDATLVISDPSGKERFRHEFKDGASGEGFYLAEFKFANGTCSTDSIDGSAVKLVAGDWTARIYVAGNSAFNSGSGHKDEASVISVGPEQAAVPAITLNIHVGAATESAEYASLRKAIAKAAGYESMAKDNAPQNYLDTQLAALQLAVKEALDEAAKFDGTAPNVSSARADAKSKAEAILTALDELTPAGDYSAMQALIDRAKGFVEGDYTHSSWYDWTHALAAAGVPSVGGISAADAAAMTAVQWAEAVVAAHVYGADRQFYIDAAVRQMETYIGKLVARAADTSALKVAIERAEAALDPAKEYTDESKKAYDEALADARGVAANANAAQSEVDRATDALNAAVKGLAEKPGTDVPEPPVSRKGWVKGDDGKSWFYFVDGEAVKNTWVMSKRGIWYFMNAEGVMVTGVYNCPAVKGYYNEKTGAHDTKSAWAGGLYYFETEDESTAPGRVRGGWHKDAVYGWVWSVKEHNGKYGMITWTDLTGDVK